MLARTTAPFVTTFAGVDSRNGIVCRLDATFASGVRYASQLDTIMR